MIEAPFTLIAEIIVPLVTGVIEVSLLVLVASTRPWAYVLSSSYRAVTNEHLAKLHPVARAWYMLWGTLALFASAAILVAVAWVLQDSRKPEPAHGIAALEEAARKAKELIKHPATPASRP